MNVINYSNYLRKEAGALNSKKSRWRLHNIRIIVILLILSFCFTAIPTAVLAQDQSEIETHVFKVYLDAAFVPDINIAKTVLPKYVKDMNTILAKNTNRRFVFDPNVDIIITTTQPFSNQAASPLPVNGFEIWAYVKQSEYPFSYGGYAGVDTNGAGVLAGLKWVKLYNPDELTYDELIDYWTQVNNMLHEFAHVFEAGIGEYYKLSTIHDTTDVPPYLNINMYDPTDSFWSDKPDFMADPLLRNAAKTNGLTWLSSREALLSYVKYSKLSATIINGNYRNAAPTIDLQNITVSIIDESGLPLIGANIKIWSVIGSAPYQARLMVDAFTDTNGKVTFAWGGSSNLHNNVDFLRLIKVYKDGYIASTKYISIFDADIVKLIHGSNLYNVLISLKTNNPAPTLISIVRASANPTNANSVDYTVTFSESVAGVDATDFALVTNGVSGAAVSRVSGSGRIYIVSAETGRGTGTIRLNLVDNDTIVDSAFTPLGGAGAGNGSYTSDVAYEVCLYQTYLPLVIAVNSPKTDRTYDR